MQQSALDPNPKNQLGKGLLPAHVESDLLAGGYIFACKVPNLEHLPFGVLNICKRNIADAVTDQELDNPYMSRDCLPLATP